MSGATDKQTAHTHAVDPNSDHSHAVDHTAARDEGIKAERERVTEIQRSVRAAKLDQSFADELIRDDVSIAQARARIIDKWAEKDTPETDTHNHTRVGLVADESEKFIAQATEAALMRANVVKMDDSNSMRGFGLQDYARACLDQAGVRTAGMSKESIAKAAITHSTSDFPNIFENVMHKTLLNSYESVETIWNRFCAIGDLSDFRAHNRYRMGSFPRLAGLQENGELKHTTLPDAEKESITASENGLIVTLSYKMIVDDDLGAFLNLAAALGLTAALSIEEDVFNVLTSNSGAGPVMSNGNNMFDTSNHGNLASSGAVVSVATLGAARTAMRKQKDPGGNTYTLLTPRVLLTPVAVEDEAWQVINSPTDPAKTNSRVVNRENNRWELLSSPYLDEVSSAAWYAFADPAVAPVMEIGFVGGRRSPEVETEEAFSSRGIAYRVTHDWGVAARDYRPAYKNPGA